jgi:hypothetical protein
MHLNLVCAVWRARYTVEAKKKPLAGHNFKEGTASRLSRVRPISGEEVQSPALFVSFEHELWLELASQSSC